MKKRYFLLLLAAALFARPSQANDLRITNVVVPSPFNLLGPGVNTLRFDLSWENSWRDSVNWDAAWVFVKYRALGSNEWHTATLNPGDSTHSATGQAINVAADGKGAFVYRAAPGSGQMQTTVGLRWNWFEDSVGGAPIQPSFVEVRVFGVEMVYIPQAPFNLNATDLPALTNEFTSVQGSLTHIASEAPLPTAAIRWINDTGAGGTGNEITVGTNTYPGSAALGANYPKGYAAGYCMKYEATQGQYTDFLNMLTRAQQIRRVAVDISGDTPAGGKTYVAADAATAAAAFRNTIQSPPAGMGTTAPITFTCDRPDRPHNFAIWADCAAYLDWVGLRPLTELEYEKICRGPLPVVAGELAGGGVPTAADTISGVEDGTEVLLSTTGPRPNYSFGLQNYVGGDAGNGPVRSGIFATATSTRAEAGAAYYGVMEMSGNVWERCITVAEFDNTLPTNASLFDRNRNGDGDLDSLGNHNVATWPNSADVLGSNFRGGNWSRPAEWAAVSDRQYGGQAIAGRTSHRGIRGGRSASTLSGPATGTNGTTFSATKYHGGSYDGYSAPAADTTQLVVTGLVAEMGRRAVEAFPNPATSSVLLRLTDATPALANATLTLTDALGRPVRRLPNLTGTTVQVEREGLAPGVYFFRLTEGNGGPVAAGRLVWQ